MSIGWGAAANRAAMPASSLEKNATTRRGSYPRGTPLLARRDERGLVEVPFLLATLLLAELAIRGMFGYEQSIWHHARF